MSKKWTSSFIKRSFSKLSSFIKQSFKAALSKCFHGGIKKDMIQKLFDKKFIKFYARYVLVLLLVKDEDKDPILKELNSYNKNTRFTVDRFINEEVHFLVIKVHQNNTDIYYKDTYTGQYIRYRSQTPWKLKT